MLENFPRWTLARAKRMRLRGSSHAMLHFILCSDRARSPASADDPGDVAWPPNVIPFRSAAVLNRSVAAATQP